VRIRREAAWGFGLSALFHLCIGAALLLAPRPGPAPAAPPRATRIRLVSAGGAPDPLPAKAARPARALGPARARPGQARPAIPGPLVPQAAAAGAVSGSAARSGPEAPSPGTGAGPAAPGGTSSAPGPAGPAGGAGLATQELSRRLALAARSCYPPAARRLRAQGEVVVEFCLDDRGASRSIRVDRPSGSALLDRAAAECVVPRALPAEGARGCFTLPVRFGG